MNAREPERQSIWSVASGWLPAYFALFNALGLLGVGFVVVRNVLWVSHPTVHDMIWAIITGIVVVGAASATASILAVETGKNIMIVGTYLEEMLKKRRARQLAEVRAEGVDEGRAEGVKKGRAEGVTKGRSDLAAEIREWNARRLAAQSKGEPFDEPPPGLGE